MATQSRRAGNALLRFALALILCAGLAGCQWLRAALQTGGTDSQRLVEQARHAILAGDLEQAARLLDRAGEVSPDDPELHRQKAQLMQAQGRTSAAISHLRYVVEHDPNDAESFVRLAELLLEQGRIGEADAAATSALDADPRHLEALAIKAAVAEKQHRPDVALEMYHRLLAENPGDASARLRIAAIHLRSGRPERAAPLLRAVGQSTLLTEQERAEAQWWLGIAYGAERRWSDAVAALTDAARQGLEMTADNWYRLAYARVQAGDLEGALGDLQQALQIQPGHVPATATDSELRGQIRLQSHSIAGTGHATRSWAVPEEWSQAGPHDHAAGQRRTAFGAP